MWFHVARYLIRLKLESWPPVTSVVQYSADSAIVPPFLGWEKSVQRLFFWGPLTTVGDQNGYRIESLGWCFYEGSICFYVFFFLSFFFVDLFAKLDCVVWPRSLYSLCRHLQQTSQNSLKSEAEEGDTPLKTNMEPENGPLEKDIPVPKCSMYGIFSYIYHQNYPNVGK